jgi:hypothetical protein
VSLRGSCAAVGALVALASACGSFENPAIVIDLRVLAMTATPPEQVAPIDPDNPAAVELVPVEVCALVADPAASRGLRWSMRLCRQVGNLRCEDDRPFLALGSGTLADPDTSSTPQVACATVPASPALIPILQDAIENDSLSGFAAIDLNVELRVVPEGGREADAVYGGKAVRYAPLVPAERVANTNPDLTEIAMDLGDDTMPKPLPLGRCVEQAAPIVLAPEQELHLEPVEPPGVREVYVVPTFEGGSRQFTENLRYQWLAGVGDWTRAGTGGPRDGAGNSPPLDTAWQAPAAADLDGPVDVPLWIIQRDERGGGRWFESCVRVMP